ncbi:hypothetical protein BH09PSE2_BH09PSE2_20130 [soil metagenome]
MRPFLLAAAAVLLVAGPAFAAAPPAWVVDRSASKVGFTGSMSGQAFSGRFTRFDAHIAFDPKNLPAAQVVATIDTGSAASCDASRDEALPTPDWFSVKAFPRAVFKSKRIAATGPGYYVADGDLTIRNVTRPVSLPFALTITGDTAKMTGALQLDRSAFGVGQGQFKGGDTVALKVGVDVVITAKRGK